MNHADPQRSGELARNVEVALRFKKNQGTPEMPQVEKEVLAAHYDRARGGNLHLANNARDTDMIHPGLYLRKALPDRVDVIERVIADGDRVGLLFRVTATNTGGFFGIPPTGKKIDVYEIALLKLANGQLVEGWFMMDEAALLQQMGLRQLQQQPKFICEGPTLRHLPISKFHDRSHVHAYAFTCGRNAVQVTRVRTTGGKAHPHFIAFGHQHFDLVLPVGNRGVKLERARTACLAEIA